MKVDVDIGPDKKVQRQQSGFPKITQPIMAIKYTRKEWYLLKMLETDLLYHTSIVPKDNC